MSTTALATVVAKFAGLNIAGKAVVGLAVAAGAAGAAAGGPAIANHLTDPPQTGQVAVTQPVATRTGSPTATQDPTDAGPDAARMAAGSGPTDLPTAAMFGQQTAADAMAGGVDGEEIENAKLRGPISLRTRGRAVTTEDFEHLALEAAPELARVRAVAAGDGADAGSVRVLVVPAAQDDAGRLRFEQLLPSDETLARVAARLDECRVVGTRVLVEPPAYRGITIVARLRARPRVNPTRLQDDAMRAIYGYFHPITGGPESTGWPFGRPVQVGEVYSVLQGLRGTELVEDVRLFGADPITGQRGQVTQRLDLEPHALVFSYEHQLMVEGA